MSTIYYPYIYIYIYIDRYTLHIYLFRWPKGESASPRSMTSGFNSHQRRGPLALARRKLRLARLQDLWIAESAGTTKKWKPKGNSGHPVDCQGKFQEHSMTFMKIQEMSLTSIVHDVVVSCFLVMMTGTFERAFCSSCTNRNLGGELLLCFQLLWSSCDLVPLKRASISLATFNSCPTSLHRELVGVKKALRITADFRTGWRIPQQQQCMGHVWVGRGHNWAEQVGRWAVSISSWQCLRSWSMSKGQQQSENISFWLVPHRWTHGFALPLNHVCFQNHMNSPSSWLATRGCSVANLVYN